MRGSSVHFKRIASALHAVSHASRDVSPEYLLPADVSMGTHVVIDDHGQVQKSLDQKMHLASRQAKATKDYSPLWEGVINLPEPAPDVTPEHQIQIVRQWCKKYEAMTGHKVLRADVHLDEGYIGADGQPHFNAHAHVMCDRTDDKGKVKKLTSTVLREVQNMTAEVTTLQRGIDARKTGRKHIGHQNFRFDAEKNRLDVEKPKADLARLQDLSKKWSDADLKKIKKLQAHIDSEPERLAAALAAQKIHLDEQYKQDRAALKASGDATQQDYQQLKKDHEKAVADLARLQDLSKKWSDADLEKIKKLQAKLDEEPARLAAALAAQKIQLDEQYRQDRAALKASGEATQADYQQLKKDHEKAVADLKDALQERDDVKAQQTSLQTKLDEEPERQKAALAAQKIHLDEQYKQDRAALKASGEATQADYQQLKKDHEKAVADLTNAQTEAGKVPALAEQLRVSKEQITTVTQQAVELAAKVAQYQRDGATATTAQADKVLELVEQVNALKPKADRVQGLEQDLAKAKTEADKVPALVAQLNAAQEQTTTVTQQSVGLARQVAQYQRDGATATTAQADKVLELVEQVNALKPKADRVQGLEQDLAKAKTEADKVPALVEQVQEITGKLDALSRKHTTFKEKAQGVVGTQNQKIAELIGELGEAKNPVLRQLAPRIPQSNLQATASRPLEASKTAQEPPKRQEAPVPEKTPREVFLALYGHLKTVLVGLIDGMRLDAVEGRLGLFSSNSRSGPRVQVLCDVPENKVMPKIGEVFDSRAIPGKGKGGIGD